MLRRLEDNGREFPYEILNLISLHSEMKMKLALRVMSKKIRAAMNPTPMLNLSDFKEMINMLFARNRQDIIGRVPSIPFFLNPREAKHPIQFLRLAKSLLGRIEKLQFTQFNTKRIEGLSKMIGPGFQIAISRLLGSKELSMDMATFAASKVGVLHFLALPEIPAIPSSHQSPLTPNSSISPLDIQRSLALAISSNGTACIVNLILNDLRCTRAVMESNEVLEALARCSNQQILQTLLLFSAQTDKFNLRCKNNFLFRTASACGNELLVSSLLPLEENKVEALSTMNQAIYLAKSNNHQGVVCLLSRDKNETK